VELGVLGPVEVWAEGQVLDAGHARRRAVLAVLLLDLGRVVPVEVLVDRVWGEAPPVSVLNTLYGYVARLRSVIAGASDPCVTLSRRMGGYLLNAEDELLDLCRFRRLRADAAACADDKRGAELLRQALGLWRGSALSGVRSPWLNAMRDTLEADRVTAVADLSDVRLRLGGHCALVGELAEQAAVRPGDERLIGQLMLALYRSGRQADALRWFERTRRHLVSEVGVDPGSALRALHQQILRADPALNTAGSVSVRQEPGRDLEAPRPPADPAAKGPSVAERATVAAVSRQLPAATGHFTGRGGELELITRLHGRAQEADFPGGTVAISAIDGMAGIGKTALALHAAHRLAGKFPNGQLFLDLHGHTQGYPPREPGEALGSLLRSLGVRAGQIPAEPEERAALYRQRLAGTQTLVVLDNAFDEAQVRPLLPGAPGCLVLITSRRRLKGLHDAHVVALDVLSEAAGIALLRTAIAPAHATDPDSELAEIARLCGQLPLALRIAGALLRHRPAWTLGYLAGLLRDERERLAVLADGYHDLRAVFDLSYAGLGERQRLLFRRLALVLGPEFDAFAVAALLDTDRLAAAGLLEDLVDHNLLVEHAAGRYRLHDLIRAHARMLADGDQLPDRDAAAVRQLGYYAYTAQRATTLIARYPRPTSDVPAPACAPLLASPEDARAWLRAERENLRAAHDHARGLALDGYAIALAAGQPSPLPNARSGDLAGGFK
jgi:DNA-binding SARP family transcriptional activator